MSYLVLARKWRPQTFDEIIGQQAIARTLANAIRLNRIAHAFLFSGPRGIGKTSTARILSKALNCVEGPTPEPCNTCQFCREITEGSSLDVLEIDGASNRGIDEIRELRENVKYSPAAARFKIIIIDEVHMLTREAFNALLKTLEEPPPHVKFILATTESHRVPVTIVSRCQRYDFRRIDLKTLMGAIREICRKEAIQIEEQTIKVLARIADGSLRDALSLLDQVISFSGKTIDHAETMQLLGRVDPAVMFGILEGIAKGDTGDVLARFDAFVENGGDIPVFNRDLMEATRDLMAVKFGAPARMDIPSGLADAFSIDQLERLFKVQLDMETALRNSEFPRLLMDAALVKMSRIRTLKPLGEILGKLEAALSGLPERGAASVAKRVPERRPASRERAQRSVSGYGPVRAASPGQPSRTAPAGRKSGVESAGSSPGENGILYRLTQALMKKKEPLHAWLEHGFVARHVPGELVIGFKPENSFFKDQVDTPEKIRLLEKTATEILGSPTRVRIVEKSAAVKSPVEEAEARKKKDKEARMQLAMRQPFIKNIVKTFDARIRDIALANGEYSEYEEKKNGSE